MADGIVIMLLLVGIPLGLAVLFGVIQGLLSAKLNGENLRALLSGLIPGLCGLATLFALLTLLSETGWSVLEWAFYLLWAGSALVGALLGWWFGTGYRRKRRKAAQSEKEGL